MTKRLSHCDLVIAVMCVKRKFVDAKRKFAVLNIKFVSGKSFKYKAALYVLLQFQKFDFLWIRTGVQKKFVSFLTKLKGKTEKKELTLYNKILWL